MSSKVRRLLSPQAFLAICLALVTLICSPLLVSYLYLARHGETMSAAKIVDRLEQEPAAYYRSIIHDNLREISLEIVKRRQPEVVAFGSSLTFDFREEFFTRPFACAGGVMDTLADGDEFATRMLKVAQPKTVLLVLNFWWFTDAAVPRRGLYNAAEDSPALSFSHLRMPYKQVKRKEISAAELLGTQPLHTAGGVEYAPHGLSAYLSNVGRRADGSQLNGLVFTPQAGEFYAPVRERFAKMDAYLMQPGRFGPDLPIRPERMDLLKRFISRFQEKGVHLILLNPPMAPPVVEAMKRSGHHQYYFQFGQDIQKLGVEAYDFHDPSPLGISTAEFSDTHHAGNTAYMRLLLEIAKRNPGSPLVSRLNLPEMRHWVRDFSGMVVAVLPKDRISALETDFLGLGVSKARGLR